MDEETKSLNQDPLNKVGAVLAGKFCITHYVGSGGFGHVYRGYNKTLREQKVVIKFLRRIQMSSNFAREARILSLLDHPNICRVLDYLPDEQALIVPFINGEDCHRILRKSGALSSSRFRRVATTVLDALTSAHKRGIAHRDIKPGNIMIDTDNHVYVIDFGIAKEIDQATTRTGAQAMTPLFAAPERQRPGIKYDPFR